MLKPFYDIAYPNGYAAGVGFYHLGHKVTHPTGGADVVDGFNQAVSWDGHVERRTPAEFQQDWSGAPTYGRWRAKEPNPSW